MRQKLASVATNTARYLVQPGFHVALSILVIQQSGAATWGSFVKVLLAIQFCVHVASWGNKEFLLRIFSETPAKMKTMWWSHFLTRSLLLPIAALILIFFLRDLIAVKWMLCWLLFAFVYQALDVLVLYRRSFVQHIAAEIFSVCIVITGLIMVDDISIAALFQWYVSGVAAKMLLLLILLRRELMPIPSIQISLQLYKEGIPFFLVGFIGMVQSRMDLYLATILLPGNLLGPYHIFITSFNLLKSSAFFISEPFVKNLYRTSQSVFRSIFKKLFVASSALTAIGLLGIYIVIPLLFSWSVSLTTIALGALYIIPYFYYIQIIYFLYSEKKEQQVSKISLAGMLSTFVIGLFSMPTWGINGALLAAAGGQLVMLSLFYRTQQINNINLPGS